MVPAACYAAAMFCLNSRCLYSKKLYIPYFYLRMRKEAQVINKAFVEIVRFKHCDSFTSISVISNRV